MTYDKDKNILVLVDLFKTSKSTFKTKRYNKLIKKIIDKNIFDIVVFSNNQKITNSLKCVSFADFLKKNEDFIKDFDNIKVFNYDGLSFFNDDFLSLIKKLNDGKTPNKIFISGAHFSHSIFKSVLDLYSKSEITPFLLKQYLFINKNFLKEKKSLSTLSYLIGKTHILKDNILRKKFLKEWLNK